MIYKIVKQTTMNHTCHRLLCFTLMLSLAFPPSIFALPTGGQVVAGSVATTVSGTQMTLNQASRTAIMNWQQFNIAPNEAVRIRQSGADAAMLARVIGGNPSELLGRLQADGKLFLINSKGILVGAGAVIDTGSFLASTLDVADVDFLKGGALMFKGDASAGIVNLGKITAREGNVLLFAHTVQNAGEITAPNGTAGLGAGTEIFLASPDDSTFMVKLNLPRTTEKTGIENTGTITAAQAELKAAGGSIYDLAINQSGLVRVTGVEQRPDGRVILTADGGTVSVTGSISAQKADGSGGEILVGGDYQGKNPAVANATRTYVGPEAKLDASATATTGDGGKVVVWADGDTWFSGAIAARGGSQGGNGGMAEVSGKQTLTFAGTSDLSAPAGKTGTLLLDPDDLTIVAGAAAAPANLTNDSTWAFAEDPGAAQTLGASTLAGLLLANSITLQATNTLTVDAPITVASGGIANPTLTLQSNVITINQNISLANTSSGMLKFGSGAVSLSLTSAAGATLNAPQVLINNFSSVTLNGPVLTASFRYNARAAPTVNTSFTANNASNAITDFVLADTNNLAVQFLGDVAVNSSTAMSVSALISAANNVTLSSGGNLTLRGVNGGIAASAITAFLATKLASTGGAFINQAGAGLLAGNGRKLIYTATTGSGFTDGGLGYTQVNSVSYPGDPQGAGNVIYIQAAAYVPPPPMLTITADDFTKFYGQPDPAFTASYSGGTSANLTTLPSFSILQGAHANVGAYTIVPSGAASGSYDLSYVNGTLTINPATLTYIANPFSRAYGNSNPVFGGSVSGFVLGDTLANMTTGTLAFGATATTASNVGRYAINGSGLTANNSNYVFAQAAGNAAALTINPDTLTYTANAASRLYGAANPVFGGSVSGFVLGDTLANTTTGTLAFTSTATTSSNVNSYAINGSGLTPNTGNYVFAQAAGNTTALTINPATLTVTANEANRLYGAANPAFSAQYSGFVNGDTAALVSGLQLTTNANAAAPVGSYTIFPAAAATAPNYKISYVNGTLNVTPAPLTITAPNASRLYGDPNVFGGAVQYSGLVNGDTVGSIYMPTSIFDSPHVQLASPATAASPVGAYAIIPSDFNLRQPSNYTVSYVNGTLAVNRIPYIIMAPDLTTLVGAVPQSFAVKAPALPSFGPQFTVYATPVPVSTGNFWNDISTPSYVLLPSILPAAKTSLGDIQAHYDIQLVPGSLKTTVPPVDPVTLKQGTTTVTEMTLNITNGVTLNGVTLNASDLIDTSLTLTGLENQNHNIQIKTFNAPILSTTLQPVVSQFGPDLLSAVTDLLNGDSLKDMPDDQRKILEQFRDGTITAAQLAALVASDPNALAAIMPALGKVMMDAIESGKPLTYDQQLLVTRMSENINTQRTMLAHELEKERLDFEIAKANASSNNIWALKTMPDIAMSAQQAATEQAIAAAIGAGAGLALGVGVATVLNISAIAGGIMTFSGVGATVAVTGIGIGAGIAAGTIGVAVGTVVIGVISAVMVAQEEQNISAYDTMLARAKTTVDTNLSGMDLKNNDTSKAEFFSAFMASMLEIK